MLTSVLFARSITLDIRDFTATSKEIKMGSFDILCSITGMTLHVDDPMVRMLIVPRRNRPSSLDSRNYFKNKAPLVSNEMGLEIFVPFGFPIRGQYHDYGQIVNIVEDKNTKILENFFGVTIYQLCNYIANDDRWLTYGIQARDAALEKQTKGEQLTSDDEWSISNAKSWWDGPDPKNINILKDLTICDIRAEVYNLMIQPPKLMGKYSIENYKKQCCNLFDSLTKNRKFLSEIKDLPSEEREERLKNKFADLEDILREHDSFMPYCCTISFLKELEIDESFKKEYIEMLNFIYSLNSYRKLLLPTLYGTQQLNYKDLLELTKLTQSLLKDNIKKHNEYYR